MREILFRGNGINDKVWYCGFYTEQQGHSYITPDGIAMYEVDPASVGQYVGINARHGNKIFEGDFLQIEGDFYERRLVDYDECRFVLVTSDVIDSLSEVSSLDIEIIGDRYSNPELLEAAE